MAADHRKLRAPLNLLKVKLVRETSKDKTNDERASVLKILDYMFEQFDQRECGNVRG